MEAEIPAGAVGVVEQCVRTLCRRHAARLPFHGWHHVRFVRAKAVRFAELNGSNVPIVEVAALVHDINYLVKSNSTAEAGHRLRTSLLSTAGLPAAAVARIENVVREAEMRDRHRDISAEAQALSDADTLYKALPVTPVMLAHRYLAENGLSLRELAAKIIGEQRGVHDDGYYFYNQQAARKYARWATVNLELWDCICEAVDDPSVAELLAATEGAPA